MKTVNIVLVGIGGYGANYVRALLEGGGKFPYKIAGAVDPFPKSCPLYDELIEANIPIYESLEQFYEVSDADLAIISSPIQFHAAQTKLALAKGSHVLCEKPLCATLEEANEMIEARDQTNQFVAIGYQWSYSPVIQQLKEDIQQGVLGKPQRFKTIVLWPRNKQYYARPWAGKRQDSEGRWILDSVANNATAHYIHNMFYLLGQENDQSAGPSRITAELYRANPIENYDTAAMRCYTDEGTELLYYASHAVNETVGVKFCYEFEKANVIFDGQGEKQIIAQFHNGEQKIYGNPERDRMNKLWTCIAAIHGEGTIHCGPEAAMSHTLCIHGMERSSGTIHDFAKERKAAKGYVVENDEMYYVEGLKDDLVECYDKNALPAELDFSWAKPGQEI